MEAATLSPQANNGDVEAGQNGHELLQEAVPEAQITEASDTAPVKSAFDVKSAPSAIAEDAVAKPPILEPPSTPPPAPTPEASKEVAAAATPEPPIKLTPAFTNGNGPASAALSPSTPAQPAHKASDSATPSVSELKTSISKRSSSGVPPLSPASNTASPAPTQPDGVSPSISVKELRKQLSTAADSPTPNPAPRFSNSGSGLTSPNGAVSTPSTSVSGVAPGQKLQKQRSTKDAVTPVVPRRSDHDQRNTTNAAQLLKLGAFKLQPLKDFVAYDELIKLRLEDGIDPTRKEDYLTEEEFAKVMGMSREAYGKMPAWRKTDAKKRTFLF